VAAADFLTKATGGSSGLAALQSFTRGKKQDGVKRAAPLGVEEQRALCCCCCSNATAAIRLPSCSVALTLTPSHLPLHALALLKYILFIRAHEMQNCKETNASFQFLFKKLLIHFMYC